MRDVLPGIVYDELYARYQQNPVALWLAGECWPRDAAGFHSTCAAKAHLAYPATASDSAVHPAWQEIQRALDGQQNDLLRRFRDRAAADGRAGCVTRHHLRECVVAAASSEEADRYLDEATRCYFLGLFTACAVMCRSVLEEPSNRKSPPHSAVLAHSLPQRATLGNLLHEVNNNLILTASIRFPRVANQVNDAGKKAVHQGLLSEDERGLPAGRAQTLQLLLSLDSATVERSSRTALYLTGRVLVEKGHQALLFGFGISVTFLFI